jgi:repressor of nif and glnA expression
MNEVKLSEMYSLATQRMHAIITELYESLHDEAGRPKTTEGAIIIETSKVSKEFKEELSLIKDAQKEYDDINSR